MTTVVANQRMTMVFDDNQPKYKCFCGCMSVRTGAAIIATLKMFGVMMAVMELFTGPHFVNLPHHSTETNEVQLQSTSMIGHITTAFPAVIGFQSESIDHDNKEASNTPDQSISIISGENSAFGAVRWSTTFMYLLVEAIAVSCLFYALRKEKPKFILPEMALVLICMSLELIVALLVIIAASFGSESLVQLVISRMRAQGNELSYEDVEQIRRLIPFVLTAFAFFLLLGAAVEFWFFRTLKAFYVYLRDKMVFRALCGDMVEVQHRCYVNGYQPMMEENTTNEAGQSGKDMPPAYQDVVKTENEADATAAATDTTSLQPPSYKDVAQPATASVNRENI